MGGVAAAPYDGYSCVNLVGWSPENGWCLTTCSTTEFERSQVRDVQEGKLVIRGGNWYRALEANKDPVNEYLTLAIKAHSKQIGDGVLGLLADGEDFTLEGVPYLLKELEKFAGWLADRDPAGAVWLARAERIRIGLAKLGC